MKYEFKKNPLNKFWSNMGITNEQMIAQYKKNYNGLLKMKESGKNTFAKGQKFRGFTEIELNKAIKKYKILSNS